MGRPRAIRLYPALRRTCNVDPLRPRRTLPLSGGSVSFGHGSDTGVWQSRGQYRYRSITGWPQTGGQRQRSRLLGNVSCGPPFWNSSSRRALFPSPHGMRPPIGRLRAPGGLPAQTAAVCIRDDTRHGHVGVGGRRGGRVGRRQVLGASAPRMVAHYIREANPFTERAAAGVGLFSKSQLP
jgi:hypothetical protein